MVIRLILYLFKEEDFDYDEGVYAELNLDNFVEPDVDNESEAESEAELEGVANILAYRWPSLIASLQIFHHKPR